MRSRDILNHSHHGFFRYSGVLQGCLDWGGESQLLRMAWDVYEQGQSHRDQDSSGGRMGASKWIKIHRQHHRMRKPAPTAATRTYPVM
jgi:hypothetical protein